MIHFFRGAIMGADWLPHQVLFINAFREIMTNCMVAILESPHVINGLRMALKLLSFCFDVKSSESSPQSRCLQKNSILLPQLVHDQIFQNIFFGLEKFLIFLWLMTVPVIRLSKNCLHLITVIK